MKPISIATLALSVLLTSCTLFGSLSEIDYNNSIVETVNASSTAIEQTATLYNETIPSRVTEKDEIDLTQMQTAYDTAIDETEKIASALNLESRNLDQQTAVRTAVTVYESAATLYLESYKKTLSYYEDGTYKEDITQVNTLDESLHTAYTTFIEANNDLVDALELYVGTTTTGE